MTTDKHTLFSLLQRSIFGTQTSFPLDVDWNSVLREAKSQTVHGIASAGLPFDLPQNVCVEWEQVKYHQLANQIRYWNAHDQLHCLLTDNGIPYVIVKGAAAAMHYPDPMLRAMGDIDFLVAPEKYEQTKALLLTYGYYPEDDPNHAPSDRHISFSKGTVRFELHHQFSYLDLNMEDLLIAGISCAELQTVEGHAFYALPTVENGLVLLAHLWNHLHSGVGLRQVLDWMMYVHAKLDDELWNTAFCGLAEKYGLKKLAITAAYMCKKYLGLPDHFAWYQDADEKLCDDLMTEILNSGNFGKKKPKVSYDTVRARSALSGINRVGFFRHMQHRGEVNWKAYHKHPWLKPFAWLYQIFRYVVLWVKSPKKDKLSNLVKQESETGKLLKRLR